MINKDIIKSIFSNYEIDKVILVEEKDFFSFFIYSMKKSIPLERWNNLENILKEILHKEITLLPYNQALKVLGNEYFNKGVVIE